MNVRDVSSLCPGGCHETNKEAETFSGEGVARGESSQTSGAASPRQLGSDQCHQRIDVESVETTHSRHARHGGQAAGA